MPALHDAPRRPLARILPLLIIVAIAIFLTLLIIRTRLPRTRSPARSP